MAIEAGDAIWRITGDNSGLQKAMKNAPKIVGAAMTAAGAAIVGFAAVSVTSFASLGDELDKMAGRTGFSTNALGELKHAAELSGATLDDVEKASKKLSTTIFEAGKGTATYTDALGYLGLQYSDLQGKSPEEQFLAVAYGLADVEDASMRAALAQQVFGRAGTQLLPMLANGRAGLEEMRAEAVRLGMSLGPETAAHGAAFNDAMQRMQTAMGTLGRDIAIALIPTLIDLMNWAKEVAVGFSEWRAENSGLFDSVTKITVVIGAVMTALGPLIIALPGLAVAWGILKAALVSAGAAMVVLTGPIGIILGAIALLGAAMWYFVEDWGAVWETAKSMARSAAEFIVNMLQPVFDMIGAGLELLGIIGPRGSAIPHIPGYPVGLATGGTIQQGGWAMVGERGPELVQLPRGATVFDSQQTAAATGGTSLTVNFGRDSVRSDEDISMIERAISRIVTTKLQTAGVRI